MATQYSTNGEERIPSCTLHLTIPPDARYARTVRDAFTGFAKFHRIAEPDLESMLFAVGEAVANALEHAGSEDDIDVTCAVDPDKIVAVVTDRGAGCRRLPLDPTPLPDSLSEHGRGFPIMQRYTDIFTLDSVPGHGTSVTLGRFRA